MKVAQIVVLLVLLFGFSSVATDSSFQKFQKIPKKAPILLPQLPEVPPELERILACRDSDGGDGLKKGSASRENITLEDRCVAPFSPRPSESFWAKVYRAYQKMFGLTEGLHDGNYHTKLEEAVCKGEPKRPAYANLDCSAINMTCMEGFCQTTKCEMDYGTNELHYNGFTLRDDGRLEIAEKLDRKIAFCKNDRKLVRRACGQVPAGKYAIWKDQRTDKKFVANQGEDYWTDEEKYCHGNDVPLPCQPDIPGVPDLKVSGCVNKAKLIDVIDNYPGTGSIVEQIRARPEFGFCAEELPRECPGGGGDWWGSGGSGSQEGGSGAGEGGGSEPVNVTSVCLPLDGAEPNNSCSPSDNGVKIVTGQSIQFFCNRCGANDNHTMYQYRCDANGLLDENFIRCAGGKICSEGHCDTCTNFQQNWCGEVVE